MATVSWLEFNLCNMSSVTRLDHKDVTLARILFTASHVHTIALGFCQGFLHETILRKQVLDFSRGNVIWAPSHYMLPVPHRGHQRVFLF